MRRKLVKQGAATMMISLPAKWIKKFNLKKGDEIELAEEEDKLIISGKGVELTKKAITYDLELVKGREDENYRYIRSLIGSAYRKGYDSIKLNFHKMSAVKLIQKAVNSLIGYEIMEQSENSCTIKSMISEADVDFDSSFRKIFHVIKLMQKIILEDISKKKYTRMSEILQLKNTGWKFRDLCLRIINTDSSFRENNLAYSLIVWSVEKISSQLHRIYKYLHYKKPKEASPETLKFIKSTYNYFNMFEKAYLSEKLDLNLQISITKEDIFKQAYKLFEKKQHNNVLIHLHSIIVRRIYDMNSSLIMIKSK